MIVLSPIEAPASITTLAPSSHPLRSSRWEPQSRWDEFRHRPRLPPAATLPHVQMPTLDSVLQSPFEMEIYPIEEEHNPHGFDLHHSDPSLLRNSDRTDLHSSSLQWNRAPSQDLRGVLRLRSRQSLEPFVSSFSPKKFRYSMRASLGLFNTSRDGSAFEKIRGNKHARDLLQLFV